MTLRLLSFVIVLLTSIAPASAEVDLLYPEALGTISISKQPDRYDGLYKLPPPNTPFEFYLVIEIDFADIGRGEQNSFNGIQAWEAQISFPPELHLLSETLLPARSINVGDRTDAVFDYVVGTGERVPAGSTQAVVAFEAMFTGPIGFERIELGPVARPTVEDALVWVEWLPANGCTVRGLPEGCQFRFQDVQPMRVTTVDGDVSSFSTLKSRY